MPQTDNPPRSAARDISYSISASTRAGRAVIRSIENMTGRLRLIRLAQGYDREVAAGRDFWEVMTERYGLRLDLATEALERIPAAGPVVVVANHPFGILDGLAMGRILSMRRPDFRIIANGVFRRAQDLERVILPISFDATPEAMRTNLATRAEAMAHLARGGCIGIFPGGTVSTAATPFGRAMDPAWRTFTAKMVARSGAAVVPVHFDGANSRLFQLVSHVHPTLRLALLINEFGARVGGDIPVTIGLPLPREEIAARARDPRALMDYLRAETYALSPTPLPDIGYGHDFDA